MASMEKRGEKKIPCGIWDVDGFLRESKTFPVHVMTQAEVDHERERTRGQPIRLAGRTVHRLSQSIVVDGRFDPESCSNDDTGHALLLKRFAVFIIDEPDTVLDLNGHKIEATEEYVDKKNPFLTLVSLSSKPFPPQKGCKVFFPEALMSADRCVVMNGMLNRASHFCVHGVDAHRVALINLKMFNFEVGGAAFTTNRGDLLVHDCMLRVRTNPSRTPGGSAAIEIGKHMVPVRSIYPLDASAVFGIQVNGGFFVAHPEVGERDPAKQKVLQDTKDSAGFTTRAANVCISNVTVENLGASFSSPQSLVTFRGEPVSVRDNFVMCTPDPVRNDRRIDPNSLQILREHVAQKTGGESLEKHMKDVGHVEEQSKWDNRDHGFKPVACVRMRGVANAVINNLVVERLGIEGTMFGTSEHMTSVRCVDLCDCNNIAVMGVIPRQIYAMNAVGVQIQRGCGCKVDNVQKPTTNAHWTSLVKK